MTVEDFRIRRAIAESVVHEALLEEDYEKAAAARDGIQDVISKLSPEDYPEYVSQKCNLHKNRNCKFKIENGMIAGKCEKDKRMFCEHNIRRKKCKPCSDPLVYMVRYLLKNVRRIDRYNHMYNARRIIDKAWILKEIGDSPSCEECGVHVKLDDGMQMISLRREDDTLGFIKGNCFVSCLMCKGLQEDLFY